MSKTELCDRCNKEPVSARFLGKDICSKCYDKINLKLNKIRIRQ